tara:strand:- start:60 stop:179 length:120 start_codon:yes stop_codon:yes gene_type:complete
LKKQKPPPPKNKEPNPLDEFWKNLGCDPKTGKPVEKKER